MNSSQIARIAANVKPLAILLLVAACGSAEPSDGQFAETPDPIAMAGSAGLPVSAGSGGSDSVSGSVTAGGASAGASGSVTSAGMGGAPEATGGQPGGSAGMATGGSPTAGAGGMSQAGATQGGNGGQDPGSLEPKPAENCPGYVDVLVPIKTCIWLHGAKFTMQNAACSISNADDYPQSCATVSAAKADIVSRVSANAIIERFDFGVTGCPKQCGG